MYASKMADITLPVQFFCNNSETSGLLEIEARRRYKIAGSKEICQFSADVEIDFSQGLHEIALCNIINFIISSERQITDCH